MSESSGQIKETGDNSASSHFVCATASKASLNLARIMSECQLNCVGVPCNMDPMSSDHHFTRTLKDNIVISGDHKMSNATLGKQNKKTDAAMPPN